MKSDRIKSPTPEILIIAAWLLPLRARETFLSVGICIGSVMC